MTEDTKTIYYNNGQLKFEEYKDGNLIPCPSMGVESYGDDIMNGLTDDERKLGRDFWENIY